MIPQDSGNRAASFLNAILLALPSEDHLRLRPQLHLVHLVRTQVLHQRGQPITDVFFPETALVSLTADTLDRGDVEVGLAGRGSLVGVTAVLGREIVSPHNAIVQLAGSAYRIGVEPLRDAMYSSRPVRDQCMRYIQLFIALTSQVAACNARHPLQARLARWLLSVQDAIGDDSLPITQEHIAIMLGVRRAGVSMVAHHLQASGSIRVLRGRICIVNRTALAAAACGCYQVMQEFREKILGMGTLQ